MSELTKRKMEARLFTLKSTNNTNSPWPRRNAPEVEKPSNIRQIINIIQHTKPKEKKI